MITKEEKLEMVKKFGKNEKDTGSAAVQVAFLTKRINDLRPHFETHDHDYHSNRGLLQMIGKRKAHLKYLSETNPEQYAKVLKELDLRK